MIFLVVPGDTVLLTTTKCHPSFVLVAAPICRATCLMNLKSTFTSGALEVPIVIKEITDPSTASSCDDVNVVVPALSTDFNNGFNPGS